MTRRSSAWRFTSRPERRAISRQWRRVPFPARREVLRLAERGERHADPAVDAAAVGYCRVALEQRSFLHSTTFGFLLSFALLTMALLATDAFPRWLSGIGGAFCLILAILDWDLKRDARKILSVPRTDRPMAAPPDGEPGYDVRGDVSPPGW